jgi:4-aminobutyrate aminotransferase/(S)-3-amino-2-methylpropionate transaminase
MAYLLRTAGRARTSIVRPTAHAASKVAPTALRRQYASAAAAAVSTDAGEQPFFPDEPSQPIVTTQVPGPKSKAAIERLSNVTDTRSLNMMANYQQSYGN